MLCVHCLVACGPMLARSRVHSKNALNKALESASLESHLVRYTLSGANSNCGSSSVSP